MRGNETKSALLHVWLVSMLSFVPHVQNGVKKHVRHESIDTSHTSDLSPRRESMCSTCLGSCQGVTSLSTTAERRVVHVLSYFVLVHQPLVRVHQALEGLLGPALVKV